MLLLAGLLLHLLTFGTLVAPVFSLQFQPASVQQCAPILLSFSGLNSSVSRAPASLTILPFNSTAIVVPLPSFTFSTGIGLNFLPFAAGEQFIASLDDVGGSNIINISDITPVLPSPINNSTCISDPDSVLPRSFALASPVVSQCQNFTINYNTSTVSQAPNVRLYSPSGPSLLLPAISDDNISGEATYTMAFSYGRGILLLMDDGRGIRETTAFLTVGGDASSPNACLSANATGTLSSGASTGIDSSLIIIICGSATGGGVAILLIFAFWCYRRRRRAQQIQSDRTHFGINLQDEKGNARPLIILDDPFPRFPTGFVTNPVDTSKSFLSPKKAGPDRNSLASWSQAIPEDQRHPTSHEAKQPPSTVGAQFSDIGGMLNMTTLQPETILNKKGSNPVVIGSPIVPQPALLSPMLFRSPSGRHLRAPSDVPADLNSRTCSTYSTVSTNPFRSHSSITVTEPSSLGTPTTPSWTRGRSINGRLVGLPSSPRDGHKVNVIRAPSKRSNTSIPEWYGGISR
ncbi:hypothetical protein BYT27DRAFT_7150464 [Phlegmacium glaucopus]|nr:hypothetical protein BYT27DRAFT_7150464 [Phlegmacium glaucopus]